MAAIRVYLVDDNLAFLQAAARLLEKTSGVEVIGQEVSGARAVQVIPSVRPDVVLMDLNMPDMDGLEATQLVKNQALPPLVVMLTLHDDPRFRAAAEAAGADGYVPKQRFPTDLLPLLKKLMAQRGRAGSLDRAWIH